MMGGSSPGGYGAPPGGYSAPPPGGYSAPPPQGYYPNAPFAYAVECPAASSALTYALVGLFVAGPILEIVAISYAISAKRTIAANPGMRGREKANGAIAIACIVYALYAIGIAIAVMSK